MVDAAQSRDDSHVMITWKAFTGTARLHQADRVTWQNIWVLSGFRPCPLPVITSAGDHTSAR